MTRISIRATSHQGRLFLRMGVDLSPFGWICFFAEDQKLLHQKADGKEEQFGDDLGDSRRKTQKDRQGIENGGIQRQDTARKGPRIAEGISSGFLYAGRQRCCWGSKMKEQLANIYRRFNNRLKRQAASRRTLRCWLPASMLMFLRCKKPTI